MARRAGRSNTNGKALNGAFLGLEEKLWSAADTLAETRDMLLPNPLSGEVRVVALEEVA